VATASTCGLRRQTEHVVRFLRFHPAGAELTAEHGFALSGVIGRVERLEPDPEAGNEKTRGLDFSALLAVPPGERRSNRQERHSFPPSLDSYLIDSCRDALERQEAMEIDAPIRNSDRAVGAQLSAEVSRRYGSRGLPEGTLRVRLKGSAGQSFGAFLAPGITCELEGDANDYLGKGLSGGRLVVFPPRSAGFQPGATSSSATWPCSGPPRGRPSSTAWPGSASRCATAGRWRWWRAWATTAAST
jgi:hypothetical protein